MIEYCTILLLETFLINQEQGQTEQIRGEIWKYFLLESTGDFFTGYFMIFSTGLLIVFYTGCFIICGKGSLYFFACECLCMGVFVYCSVTIGIIVDIRCEKDYQDS